MFLVSIVESHVAYPSLQSLDRGERNFKPAGEGMKIPAPPPPPSRLTYHARPKLLVYGERHECLGSEY